jgi:hypothetical protein
MNGGVGGPVVGSKGLANRFACAHQMLQLRIKTTEGIFNVRSVDATSPSCCLMDWPMLESEGSCLTPDDLISGNLRRSQFQHQPQSRTRKHRLGRVELLAQFLDYLIGRGIGAVVQTYRERSRLGIG